MAKAKRKPNANGDETKARILAATFETIRTEGIVGTSARAIARTGDFNQALIFYHYGSVDSAIVAAVKRASDERMERHREKLIATDSLPGLIRAAKELHEDDSTTAHMTVLTQALAGGASDDEMGPQLYAALQPWDNLVKDTIDRVLASSTMAGAAPTEQIAKAIGAMFLGIELIDGLDPERAKTGDLFDSLEGLAQLLELLLATPLLEMFLPGMGADSGPD